MCLEWTILFNVACFSEDTCFYLQYNINNFICMMFGFTKEEFYIIIYLIIIINVHNTYTFHNTSFWVLSSRKN